MDIICYKELLKKINNLKNKKNFLKLVNYHAFSFNVLICLDFLLPGVNRVVFLDKISCVLANLFVDKMCHNT